MKEYAVVRKQQRWLVRWRSRATGFSSAEQSLSPSSHTGGGGGGGPF